MKHVYQAMDGKIFYSEVECVKYEEKIKLSDNILYFTISGVEVTDFGKANFVLIKTLLGAKIFAEEIRADKCCNEEWRDSVDETYFEEGGLWYYDDDEEIYKHFPCNLTTLYAIMKKL